MDFFDYIIIAVPLLFLSTFIGLHIFSKFKMCNNCGRLRYVYNYRFLCYRNIENHYNGYYFNWCKECYYNTRQYYNDDEKLLEVYKRSKSKNNYMKKIWSIIGIFLLLSIASKINPFIDKWLKEPMVKETIVLSDRIINESPVVVGLDKLTIGEIVKWNTINYRVRDIKTDGKDFLGSPVIIKLGYMSDEEKNKVEEKINNSTSTDNK